MLERTQGDDDGIDFRSLPAETNQPFDNSGREQLFYNPQKIGFRGGWVRPSQSPICTFGASISAATLCHKTFGKMPDRSSSLLA